MRIKPVAALSLGALCSACIAPPYPRKPPAESPTTASTVRQRVEWHAVDATIDRAVAAGRCPGAVLLVGRGDDVVYLEAYGSRALAPTRLPMTRDTIFDLASLTKPLATAPSIMILADRGKLRISDPVWKYIPGFEQNGKEQITIEQLLLHRGGLPPDDDMSDYSDGPAEAWKRICAIKPISAPGSHFVYSDVGYIVLGKVVEAVSGEPFDRFAQREIFQPLGMSHAIFNPPQSWRSACAPTEQRNGHWMLGEVHDPRAFALGGMAGHAGLFATADDLSRYCRMVLHDGRLGQTRVLSEQSIRDMTREQCLPDRTGCRGLGFDIDTRYSTCRGERFARGKTFGHTGFTGTMFWIDPEHQCYFILLTNAVHPAGKGNIRKLRHDVATAVGEALLGAAQTRPASGAE